MYIHRNVQNPREHVCGYTKCKNSNIMSVLNAFAVLLPWMIKNADIESIPMAALSNEALSWLAVMSMAPCGHAGCEVGICQQDLKGN